MRMRNGNSHKREHSFSIGVLGIDATAEGPFMKGKQASYLINYRYSSLGLLDQMNIVDFDGIPIYQDLSFKVVVPTPKAGTFNLFGLGGDSRINQGVEKDDNPGALVEKATFSSGLGVVGLNHTYQFNEKAYIVSSVSAAYNNSGYHEEDLNAETNQYHEAYNDDLNKIYL
ncbi:MAG: hypothetical protein HC896_17040 [Bacteroidales bacterium]|nr:hypothetical protein [Bacteroidales bacterium]